MKKLSVPEYAKLLDINESTVRKHIRAGKVDAIEETFNNRKVYKIILDDNDPIFNQYYTGHGTAQNFEPQEAEIIDESEGYHLISMEKDSFDNLIDKFEKLSQDRAKALESTLELVRAELFEMRAENKKIAEELYKERINAAQIEVEIKIKDIKINEMEEHNNKLKSELDEIISIKSKTETNAIKYKEEMEEIKTRYSILEGDIKEAKALIDKQEKEINEAIAEAHQLEEEKNKLKEYLAEVGKKNKKLEEELSKKQGIFGYTKL
ncbi:MAG: hypothetical protein AB1782_07775 [Cyanobacteriota bacterium]